MWEHSKKCPAKCGAFLFASIHCRSELARDGRKDDALNQKVRVIVYDHREQARSYNKQRIR